MVYYQVLTANQNVNPKFILAVNIHPTFTQSFEHIDHLPLSFSVINVMVDPDGTLDALASLGLASPTTPSKPQATKTTSPSATSPGSTPPAKESLPEILPGPGGATTPARVQASSASTEESAQDPSVGLGLTGVGGLPFNRMRPSGEEAVAQK